MYLCDFLHTLRTDAAFPCLLRVDRSLLHQPGCICQLALRKTASINAAGGIGWNGVAYVCRKSA